MRILLFSLFFINISVFVQAQENEDLSDFFDDKGISTSKNIVSINLVSTLYGNPTIHYERAFGKIVSCDLSAGIISTNYQIGIFQSQTGLFDFNPTSGFSYSINPRLYTSNNFYLLSRIFKNMNSFLEGYFFGIYYRNRHFETIDNSFVFQEYLLHAGFQAGITKRITFDINYGYGLIIKKDINTSDMFYEAAQMLHAKIGYRL